MTMTRSESYTSSARLTVSKSGSRIGQHVVVDGASLMIGSGSNCGIRLEDPTVSSIHCIVRSADGFLFVQDWCSKVGTFLGEQRVDEEMVVPTGSCIRVGRFEVLVERIGRSGAVLPRAPEPTVMELTPTAEESIPYVEPAIELVDEVENHNDIDEDEHDAPEIDAYPLNGKERSMADLPQREMQITPSGYTAGDDRRRSEAMVLAGIDPETVSLLQAEIECLQRELSDRDRQVAELQAAAESRRATEPEIDSSETEALVGRLEQLLEELEQNDQRIRVLEDLLRSEQEVSRAQKEEQSQVEGWLKDIEHRIEVREQEWQAERETLLRRAQQYKDERDETDRRFEAAEQSPHGMALQQNVVRDLREQIDQLQDRLDEATRAKESLEGQLDSLKSSNPEDARQAIIDEALREERLKLAQEQAAISRERAQLARHLADIEQQAHRERRLEPEERFRAFRQTLKELHRQEQVRSPGVRKATLGTRIADLWRKLDGPTDTD